MKKLYIAYGSNLHLEQMDIRCPTAKVYAIGVLNNWRLIYRGSMTGYFATIKRCKGSSVPVLLWEIEESDELSLDIYEGYPRFYHKQNVMVTTQNGRKLGMVYIMDTFRKPGKPSKQYINTVRTGYIENSLDISYLEESLDYNRNELNK